MAHGYSFKGKTMELEFYNFTEVEIMKPVSGMALISICSPGVKFNISYDKWQNSLILEFDDVGEDDSEYDPDNVFFSKMHANLLIDFINGLPETTKFLAVHCTQGVSRSGAVVKFLTKHVYPDCFNAKFDRHYSHYNKHVYEILEREWKK
jgi:predicted protein tyrosine phosphatase